MPEHNYTQPLRTSAPVGVSFDADLAALVQHRYEAERAFLGLDPLTAIRAMRTDEDDEQDARVDEALAIVRDADPWAMWAAALASLLGALAWHYLAPALSLL